MIIDEMIEYYRKKCKITQAEVDRLLEMSPMALAQVWNRLNPSTPDQVKEFYTTVDYTAEQLRYHNLDSRRDTDLDILIEVRAKNREARVLDFGCGTGVIGFMLKDAMPRLEMELYDLSSPALDFGRDFNVTRKRPVEFVNTFDIQHRTYDFIICNDVLEHIHDELLEETIDFIQSRLTTPYGKIFAQIGFYYEPHLIPMHFDWTEKRCNMLRNAMRWEFWSVNHDFLNLVLKGNLRNITRTVSASLGQAIPVQAEKQRGQGGERAPQSLQPLAPQESKCVEERKGPTNGSLKQPAARVSMPTASAAPPHTAARKPVQTSAQPMPSERRVAITKKGVLYVGFPCNIRCKFCYYTYHQTKDWHTLDECTRDARLFSEKYGNKFVDITGGEPTIYPHIMELLDYCNEIDLKPTLITNVQALAKEDKVKQFKDHGVYDFLCSVHALGDTYSELVQSRRGWKNLTEGIDNINKYEIPWRANCTMTRINMDQFKDIAQWVKDRNCRIINFINFNPFEEWKSKMDIDFQARHSEIGPRLVEALDHCDRIGLEANVRYFPFCHMRGHEEKCINFQQLSYDPNEWDFCSWYAPETRAPADKLPDSVRMAASNDEELHQFVAQAQKRALYVQSGACTQCSHFAICDGFTCQYHSRFGMEEAAPYQGPRLTDPATFIARRTGSAYVQGPATCEQPQNAAHV
jgi:MoaA/NifB/PqqE/SkfB family radical SAM enzyme/SAM-dependent methyltransferase